MSLSCGRLLIRYGLLLFFLTYIGLAQAGSQWEALADDPVWHALLHINEGGTWRHRGSSYVTDEAFFLAGKEGKNSPLAELKASIDVLQADGKQRCRYPARYRFLAKRLHWQEAEPFAACPDYLAWRSQVPDQRLSLIFPAAYLNSPSSMFGHVFLRLDAERDPESVFTSWAVSFAAYTGGDMESFAYAFKGIFGSYPGYFSVSPYAEKLDEYSNLENRDIWEYPLTLTPKEVGRMVDHLWELKDTSLGYYFFDENCAYGLLGLIQVARPSLALTREWRFSQSPVDAVRELAHRDVVESRHYRPSKEVALRHLAADLSGDEQRLAKQLATSSDKADGELAALTPGKRLQVLNLAYRYLRYQNTIGERDVAIAKRSMALLRLIQANAGQADSPSAPPTPVAPDLGHDTRLLALQGGQRDGVAYADLEWRYVYHDWLDNSAGFLRGAEINGLDVVLRQYLNKPEKRPSNRVRLQSLQLVDIRSLAPRDRFVKPVSWFVDGGLERVEADGDRLARYFQGGAGLSWQVGQMVPYWYAKARVENNGAYKPLIEAGAGTDLGVLYYRGNLSAQLGIESVYFANDDWRAKTHMGINWALGRNDALRLTAQHERYRAQRINQWGVAWRHYY